MRPQPDAYPEHIENAIRGLLGHGLEAGAKALAPIAYPPRDIARRPSLSRAVRCKVFRRDHFLCRYCGGKTIPTPIMELLGGLYPDVFPFESATWRGGATHPAILSRSPMVDHVDPGSTGGDWTDLSNLVTACNPCNSIKADFTLEQLGWRLRPAEQSGWDGLVDLYLDLWRAAGKPKPAYHEGWLRDLGAPGGAITVR